MTDFADLIRQGTANAWLFIPTAIMLGALHGLEPGHSKTMMAAFIVAIHGTVGDAVLLGVAAALSHSLVVWGLAAAALAWGNELIAERAEPYLMTASGLIVVAIALVMAVTQWRARQATHGHDHDHADDHRHEHADDHRDAHADQIRTVLALGKPGRGRIALFGLTGGLLPCPAAITVLLICLNLKQVNLGVAMVASFSVGLGLTLVGVGIVAALGLRAMGPGGGRLAPIVARLPYLSMILMAAIGLAMTAAGLRHAI